MHRTEHSCRASRWLLSALLLGLLLVLAPPVKAEADKDQPRKVRVRVTRPIEHDFEFTNPKLEKPPFKLGEHLHFSFGWQGLSAAKAETRITDGVFDKQKVYKLEMKVHTLGRVAWLWDMGDFSMTFLKAATFKPIAYYQTTNENGKRERSLIHFYHERKVARRFRRRLYPDPKFRKYDVHFQDARDPVSIFYLLRTMPLKKGSRVIFEIIPDSNVYAMEAHVVGFEKVKVEAGTFDAAKVRLRIHRLSGSKKKREETAEKYEKVYAWVSTDANRLPLRLESSVFVGKVFAELEKYTLGSDPVVVGMADQKDDQTAVQ